MKRLIKCIRALGFRLGWRYWKVENSALVKPWIVLEWATACERKAGEMDDVSPELADAHRKWAKKLRDCYDQYKWGRD